jgi:hypothetical protein
LTGQEADERRQERLSRRLRGSRRAEKEDSSYLREWSRMLERGGNGYVLWPLEGLKAILEKTICNTWDGEDSGHGGRPGCGSFVDMLGMQRVVHDHIRLRLRCRGETCGREVTVSNQEVSRRLYGVLPPQIRQVTYSAYVLRISLFLLVTGARASAMRRVWDLLSLPAMSSSTHYAYQHVVWHFIGETWEAEMEAQRRRQDIAAARYTDGRRRLVLSADGAWAHTGHMSKQFTYVVQDVSRDWYTLEHETREEREVRLTQRRQRPPIVYLHVIDKGRSVVAHSRRCAGPGTNETEELKEEVREGVEGEVNEEANEEVKEEVKEGPHAQPEPRQDPIPPRGDVAVREYRKQGNWASEGGSAGMEAQAFLEMMKALEGNGLLARLSTLVVDQDLTVAATLREHHPQIRLAADPGHVRKSLRKSFNKVFTTRKPFRYMSYRQVAWMMRTLKVSEDATDHIVDDEERAEKIMELQRNYMRLAVWHYFNVCGPDCPHRQRSVGVETDSKQLLEDLEEAKRQASREEGEGDGRVSGGMDARDDEEDEGEAGGSQWMKEEEKEEQGEEGEDGYDHDEEPQSEAEPSQRSTRSRRSVMVPGSGDELEDDDLQLVLAMSRSEFESQSQGTATEMEGSRRGSSPARGVTRRGRGRGRGRGTSAGRSRGRGGSRGGGRGRSKRTSDESDGSDYRPAGEKDGTGKGRKQREVWTALISKHRTTIDEWMQIIQARARQKRDDEEAGRPQRLGTAREEDDKVTGRLGLAAFQWKLWLDMDASCDQSTRCWEKWLALIADHCLPEQMRQLCHGYNTCHLESFHSTRTALTPKDVTFWASFKARAEMAALKWNVGYEYVARVAERMQVLLTPEEMATLKRMDRVKDREAHRRQQPEMKRKVAMRSKEVEMRMRHQQLVTEREKKERAGIEKGRLDADLILDLADSPDVEADPPAGMVSHSQPLPDAEPAPLTVPHSRPLPEAATGPVTPSPAMRASSSPTTAASLRRSRSLKYKSPAEKQLPYPTSVEVAAAAPALKASHRSRQSRKRPSADVENELLSSSHPNTEKAPSGGEPTQVKDEEEQNRQQKKVRRALRELN